MNWILILPLLLSALIPHYYYIFETALSRNQAVLIVVTMVRCFFSKKKNPS